TQIPTFRPDISIEEDLIEEIGRIYGYDKIIQQAPRISASGKGWSELSTFRKTIRQLLIGSGFDETVSLSFTSSSIVKQIMDIDLLKLKNPMTEDMDCLRPSLVFGLIDSLSYNAKRQIRDIKFFEIAKVYYLDNGVPIEKEKVGVIMTGQLNEEDYTDHRSVSLLSMKGVLDELSDHLSVNLEVVPAQIDWLTAGRSGKIQLENETVGIIGMLNSKFNQIYDIKGEVYYMELDLEQIFKNSRTVKQLRDISNFPAVRRDISLLIPIGFSSQQITSFLMKSNQYVEKVGVSDIYTGKDIPQNMMSVTFYVIYRASDRSLTDEEINTIFDKTVGDIESTFGVKRRFV
ncbi:MAG TPA: phenylalanine--tRNA ligase subunit beta, partial [Pseudothermotoga sp.]